MIWRPSRKEEEVRKANGRLIKINQQGLQQECETSKSTSWRLSLRASGDIQK